jgi:hypothetical protein
LNDITYLPNIMKTYQAFQKLLVVDRQTDRQTDTHAHTHTHTHTHIHADRHRQTDRLVI